MPLRAVARLKAGARTLAPNAVLLTLSIVMLAALWLTSTVSVAPNRIVPGSTFGVVDAFGVVGALLISLLLLALAAMSLKAEPVNYQAMLLLVVLILLLMPFGLMVAGHLLIDPALAQARLGIGAGYWTLLFVLLLCLIELRLRLGLKRLATAALLVGVTLVWWLCARLWLDELALVQELHSRQSAFYAALSQHLVLVASAVGVSLVLGMTIALLMRRFTRVEKVGFALLNFFQTIPSLALFGLLLAPLAWLGANVTFLRDLGVSGIGNTPALVALIAYSLLPIARNTYIALGEVRPDTLEAATAMGMRPAQRFWQVRFPLALPVLLEGVRITTVQAVGLTAVAALIGAGGLGTFIFQGLGQAAMDMVLLGALPIVVMALIVDAGLGALAELTRHGGQA
ncbi:ABC transporter permease [Halomonas sp. GD1P12]|uniref:ABC transporter permease n=1 Tax=Halomonas sp. GD1P12 TaxID=2982691 RepID=UPI0021E4E032|nr:ABC transporter permease [Halomonas sp. GD1P12]UYF98453.1 ABC transporter permease [Halomonas sp. GD1P12]